MMKKEIITKILIIIGVGILQVIAAMLVLLVVTLVFPRLDVNPNVEPVLFIVTTGLSFSLGIFLAGWIALKLNWRITAHKYCSRLLITVIGTFLPLLLALVIYPILEPGNPFFFIAILTGIIGFLIPEIKLSKAAS